MDGNGGNISIAVMLASGSIHRRTHRWDMKETIEKLMAEAGEVVADLRACHEYYCKYNCGTLVRTAALHTLRCQRLQVRHGFPAYTPPEPAPDPETIPE